MVHTQEGSVLYAWAVLYARAAPWILRWEVQNRIRERIERNNFFVPPVFQTWGTSKQISVWAYWIYWNLLFGCRINIGRPRPMVLWIRERDSLVMARLVSWLNLAAMCHTLYSARSDFGPLTSSRECFEIMLGINNRIDLNNAAVQWGWTVVTRPKPCFQISLTWPVSTRVRGVEIQSLVQYWIKTICCRSKDHFHWNALHPASSVPHWSQKWWTLSPTPSVCAAHASMSVPNLKLIALFVQKL